MQGEPRSDIEQVPRLAASYVLPIAAASSQARNLGGYLARLARYVDEVIVVDGSPPAIFREHGAAWGGKVRHIAPQLRTANGKVGGVVTGVREAQHERVIVADDDVRYRRAELARLVALLETFAVVRPQNFFHPLPWHARWDTGRILLNRAVGGDWPGTLGVRRSFLLAAGGYRGDILFENLEMVRTICAAGGQEHVALELLVARRPPDARHFLSQRVRQAYDEWARPGRFVVQLALLPLLIAGGAGAALGIAGGAIVAAEIGRRRAGGRRSFPASSALWAPLWVAERAATAWAAFGTRLLLGGVRYRSGRLKYAATPAALLRHRLGAAGR